MPSGRSTWIPVPPVRPGARLRSREGASQRELVALSLLLVPNAEAGDGA